MGKAGISDFLVGDSVLSGFLVGEEGESVFGTGFPPEDVMGLSLGEGLVGGVEGFVASASFAF